MSTFIALLRGVNIGKAKRVPMAGLRDLLTKLGYSDVVTLLNSGNAVFRASKGTAEKHAAAIATAIASTMQVDVPVIVKSTKELSIIIAENTLAEAAPNHSRLLVAFVQDPKSLLALAAITPLVTPSERFHIGSSAAYLGFAEGVLDSKAGEALLGKIGKAATTRNWATVLKLQALASKVDE